MRTKKKSHIVKTMPTKMEYDKIKSIISYTLGSS